MEPESYKRAKTTTGIKHSDAWCREVGIASSTDRAYSSGRLSVPGTVASTVNRLVEKARTRAEELRCELEQHLPNGWTVALDPDTLNLRLSHQPSGTELVATNSGVDILNSWGVYELEVSVRPAATTVFLHRAQDRWESNPGKLQWCIWRGRFRDGAQNYQNPITTSLLEEILAGVEESGRRPTKSTSRTSAQA